MQQPQTECREVICSLFRGRYNKDLLLWVAVQSPEYERSGNPGFPYASEGHEDLTAGAMLEVVGHVVLDWCWVWEVQELPADEQEPLEVFLERIYFSLLLTNTHVFSSFCFLSFSRSLIGMCPLMLCAGFFS